jgi:hypothetical protein
MKDTLLHLATVLLIAFAFFLAVRIGILAVIRFAM